MRIRLLFRTRDAKAFFGAGLATLVFCASGCHTAPVSLNTPSGRPEVVIQAKNPQQVLNAARDFFLHRGYTLYPSDNDNKLIFSRRSEKPGAGPSKDSCWRVHLTLANRNNGTYDLTGTPTKVDACGGELEAERVMPFAFMQIQTLLQEIKAQVEFAR